MVTHVERKKPRKKTKAREKMVQISLAVALLMPTAEVAQAQFAVNCSRPILYDTFAPCGGGGTITVTPNTGKISTNGCIVILGTPKEARCSAKSFATTGSISIQLSAKQLDIKGGGTRTMSVKNFNIGTSAGGPTKVYTSAALTADPLLFGVGADLLVGPAQTNGAYSGNLVMTVIFTP